MKKSILYFLTILGVFSGFSQSDGEAFLNYNHQKSPELISLYEQSRVLDETNASAEAIEANRLAIKDAWMQINPEIGNLYKPIETHGKLPEIMENVHINGLHSTGDEGERVYEDNSQNRWGTDIQIFSGFVDGGVDVVTDDLGHIYTLHYESFGTTHVIYIHKSIDEGDTWEVYAEIETSDIIVQAQLISIHGTGDNYLLAYFLTDSNTFQVVRWNTTVGSGGSFSSQVIALDVAEFSVDRNYPTNTNSQRVFAIYKTATTGFARSARSTVGSFGLDWVDESPNLLNVNFVDLAYGSVGACYVAAVGSNTGNLWFNVNPNYNDPASWGTWVELEQGTDRETLNPTIVAARAPLASDNVLIFASSREEGTANHFDGRRYRRINSGAFSSGGGFSSGGPNFNILHPDSYIRFINDGVVEARLSFVQEVIDNSFNNQNYSSTYNGTFLGTSEPVSDPSINVFPAFKSAVGELPSTNEPILVFARSSPDGLSGQNLYFDKQSAVLHTIDLNAPSISVYPNPTANLLYIQSTKEIDRIRVFDVTGRETSLQGAISLATLPNGGTNTSSIDVSNLKSGIYFIEVTVNGRAGTYRFIKR